jgi:hypothetical protein
MNERTRRALPTHASLAAAGLVLAAGLTLVAAPGPARAAEPQVLYPARVTTLQGRVFKFTNVGHSRGDGYFVIYDGETEGRVLWRDLDAVVFAANLRHRPGAQGPRQRGTERVELKYVDGTERVVNMIVGDIHGYDGISEHTLRPADLTRINFDQARIAPRLYNVCERGHVWEERDYRFCPYDGLPLDAWRVDGK